MKGQFDKACVEPKKVLKEFRLDDTSNYEVGAEIKADVFAAGDKVDVTGVSKGHGYQGPIKRHGQSSGPMGHGSGAHRIVGSMGPIKGNMKGKKMPGHMGHDTVTLQNLTIALVDAERQLILIRGNVPCPKSGLVEIKTAVKSCK